MTHSAAELTRELERKNGVPIASVASALERLKVVPPDDYLRFIAESNGAEGPVGPDGYLVLWSIDRIGPLNDAYHVAEFAPSLVLFGSDGGDTGYAFHKQRPGTIVSVPFVGMSNDNALVLAESFTEFLERISVASNE